MSKKLTAEDKSKRFEDLTNLPYEIQRLSALECGGQKVLQVDVVLATIAPYIEARQSRLKAIAEEVEVLKDDFCNVCGEGWKECGCHVDGRNELADEVLQIIQQHLQDD